MKKFFALLLVLTMMLSLAACGSEPDLTAASEAYTKASTAFNDVAITMNENPGAFGEEELPPVMNPEVGDRGGLYINGIKTESLSPETNWRLQKTRRTQAGT